MDWISRRHYCVVDESKCIMSGEIPIQSEARRASMTFVMYYTR
jgi:hypothetical protein